MRHTVLLVIFALSVSCKSRSSVETNSGGGRGSAVQTVRPAPPPPAYPVRSLLRNLRQGIRRELESRVSADLTDLPYYRMKLTLTDEKTFSGEYVLYFKNRTGADLRVIPLLLHANAARELGAKLASRLAVTDVEALEGPPVTIVDRRPTLIDLRFAKPIPPDGRVELKVSFRGELRQLAPDANDLFANALSSLGAFSAGGASDYGLVAHGGGIVTLASAYPMVAPFRGGAFDTSPPTKFGDLSYNALAHYDVETTLPAGFSLATNLVEIDVPQAAGSGPSGGGGAAVTRYRSVGAATRDLVLVAGPSLATAAKKVGDVTVRSIYRTADAVAGKRMLDHAAGALELFEARFGRYPYTELDVAEATLVGGAGGVEFPGMVLVAAMLYRKPSQGSSSIAGLLRLLGTLGAANAGNSAFADVDRMIERMATFTVAHEVAHQYFAGLVGSDARQHPAVDEPLAQFAAGEYVKQLEPGESGVRWMETNVKLNYAFYRLTGGSDVAAAQPVAAFPSALAYAAIIYGKAPYFYVDLRQRVGAARFDEALRKAIDAHRFALITTETWLATLRRHVALDDYDALAKRWLKETHGDEDLGVRDPARVVFGALLGDEMYTRLERSFAALGLAPGDLFKLLMQQGLTSSANSQAGGASPLAPLQQLMKGLTVPQ